MTKYYIGISHTYFGLTLFFGLFVGFSILNFAKIEKTKQIVSLKWQNTSPHLIGHRTQISQMIRKITQKSQMTSNLKFGSLNHKS